MGASVRLIARPSQAPLLFYGVLPVSMRGHPPWWAGNRVLRRLQGAATRTFSTHLIGALGLRAYFLLNLLSEFVGRRRS
jgi:hypothetical protein